MRLPRAKLVPTKFQGGRQFFRLAEPYFLDLNGAIRLTLTVPAGFETDFASVPRLLWPLFPPTGPWLEASIVHDFCYSGQVPFSRFLADALFRELMKLYGVPLWRRVLMYYAVRLFGWLWWRKSR